MSRNVRLDPQGSGRWQDADTGQLLPIGWTIGNLQEGDTYARSDGRVWTIKSVSIDPETGAARISATAPPPAP